jgi:hypothetical protein
MPLADSAENHSFASWNFAILRELSVRASALEKPGCPGLVHIRWITYSSVIDLQRGNHGAAA